MPDEADVGVPRNGLLWLKEVRGSKEVVKDLWVKLLSLNAPGLMWDRVQLDRLAG